MDIQTQPIDNGSLITLSGRMDAQTAPPVREALQGQIDAGRSMLVVDMARVDFVDSSGLSVLVSSMKRSRQAGGDLILAGLNPQVRVIFELTRLDRAFEIYADPEMALAAIPGSSG